MVISFNVKDNKDMVASVNAIMDWAFNLKYSDDKSVQIATSALTKRGLINNIEARFAANMYLDLKGLHYLAEKYISVDIDNDSSRMMKE